MNYKLILLSSFFIINNTLCFGAKLSSSSPKLSKDDCPLYDSHTTELDKICEYITLTPPSSFYENRAHINALAFIERQLHISPVLFYMENQSGNAPLHIAASFGSKECLQLILSMVKSNINDLNKAGYSSLHLAITCGNIDAIKILLFYGADINQYSKDGYTPLHLATIQNKVEIVRILLAENADFNLRSKEGFTAIEYTLKMLFQNSDLSEIHAASFLKKELLLSEEEKFLFKELATKSKAELIDIMTEWTLEYRAIERDILTSSEMERHLKKTKSIYPYLQKLKIINLVFESFALQEQTEAYYHKPDTRIRDMINEKTLIEYEKEQHFFTH